MVIGFVFPNECRGLADVYGEDFNKLYMSYEERHREGKLYNSKMVKARQIWFKVLDSQMETGTPYLLYKDACNLKSNQKNIGTIKSSNLCTEIIEYSDSKESAVAILQVLVFLHLLNQISRSIMKS